jgi:two-component system sensor histidine kinase ChiS
MAKNGILDLRNWNLKTQGVLALNGEWEFYPNEFILPNQFSEKKKPS